LSWKGSASITGQCHAGLRPFGVNWTNMALDHYPPLALSGAFFPVIASLIAGLVIILRIMMENKYGMISTSIVGNYTLDNPTSFTGKITWDLIGNISWDETVYFP
jgi:hypothetical protein